MTQPGFHEVWESTREFLRPRLQSRDPSHRGGGGRLEGEKGDITPSYGSTDIALGASGRRYEAPRQEERRPTRAHPSFGVTLALTVGSPQNVLHNLGGFPLHIVHGSSVN